MPPPNDKEEKQDSTLQKRRLSAIMFTDIRGFTSMIETDEVTAIGLVKAQREIIRKCITAHGGEERETIGDAFLVIFESTINAVRCAIDIQRDIWEYNNSRDPQKQVWVRIGIHLGDIIIEDGSIFGEGVNVAARVEPLAEAGGVCITKQVYEQIKHHLDIRVRRLGVRDLKNVTDVPALYHICLPTVAPRGPLTIAERLKLITESPRLMVLLGSALAVIVFAAIYWFYFAPHTDYAHNMASIYHSPAPRFKISRGSARLSDHYYKFSRRGRRVMELSEVKRPMIFPEDARAAWDVHLSRKARRDFPLRKYKYRKGEVAEEYVYDEYGVLQYRLVFDKDGKLATAYDAAGFAKTFENQITSFGYDFDEHGRAIKVENRNAFGALRNDNSGVAMYEYRYNDRGLPVEAANFDVHGNPIENKSGVASTTFSYNDMGLPVRGVFFDRYKAVHESIRGYAIIEYEYDRHGRKVLVKYADRSGQMVANNAGACAERFAYDEIGRLTEVTALSCAMQPKPTRKGYATVRYVYDEKGCIISERFLDDKGQPTVDDSGVSSIEVSYNDAGRISQLTFTGPDGKKTLSREQTHIVRYRYDELGRPISRLLLGLDAKPTIGGMGFAEARVKYDERGNPTEWGFFDPEGSPVNNREGYATLSNKYDQFDNVVSKAYFDKGGEPTFGKDETCHRIEIKYDDKGDLAETRCFDGKGVLTPGIKNCAINKYKFDKHGKLTQFECYIDEGKFIDAPNIPSKFTVKYDKRGYTSEIRAYDANGEPAERYQGAAIWRRISDDYGNEIEISTYDRNEQLINNPKYRAAIFRREFDNRGNETRIQLFDQDKKPTTGIWGFAEIRSTYDNSGHKTSESFFNGGGKPVTNHQGVHEYRKDYDANGRLAQVTNIGADGMRVTDNNGIAQTNYEYNTLGQTSAIHYYSPDNEPVLNRRSHCASLKFTNDDRGNVVQIRCFDTEGAPCRVQECSAVTEQSFDAKGQMIKKIFRDADGNRTVDEYGAGGYENEYDPQGRISIEHVLDTSDNHATDEDGVHGYHRYYRPEFDRSLWFMIFFDTEGRPCRSVTGGTMRITLYDPIYSELAIARVDTNAAGRVFRTECLDKAGNVTQTTGCVTAGDVQQEIVRIRPVLGFGGHDT